MHLPCPCKPLPSYSRFFCFLTASSTLAPTIQFSPSRHHDSPKCTSRHAAFLPDTVQWLPLYCIYLKPRCPTTGNRTDPRTFPCLSCSLLSARSSHINSSVPWVSLSPHLRAFALADLSAWNLLSLTWSLRVPSWHLDFGSNVTSSQRLSNILESHKQQI